MIQKKVKNIQLPAIGQGMGIYDWDDRQIRIICHGINFGMNFIDTAENYGKSENIIGKAIGTIRDRVIVGTKFSPEHSSYKQVIESAERSLKRLKTDYIDLYQSHWPNPEVPIEETLSAMRQLVKEGKVRFIGLSNVYDTRYLRDIDVLQVEYNLFDRTIEDEILPECDKNGIMVVAYTPLEHGRLSMPECKVFLEKLSRKYHKTPTQIALRWVTRSPNVVAIPKTSNTTHIIHNAFYNFDMDEEDIRIFDYLREKTVWISPSSIRVVNVQNAKKKVYTTTEDAKKNELGFAPSPIALAEDITKTGIIKPIRVIENNGEYTLSEGSVRYWAWVLAFGNKPIPTLVRKRC